MQPVLALELSTDGILLHELSYDGVWRRISAASLSDPFLPKKMLTMRRAARDSQGRFFKNQIWLPPEQIKGLEVKLTASDPDEKQAEAEALVRADSAFSDGEYIVQYGEEDVNGNTKIAAVNKSILKEASRFASGYGFSSEGFTSRDRIDGFYKQPVFTIAPPPKVTVDFGKIGFYAGIAITAAAIVAGGYWAYTSIDFTRDPSVAISATEEHIFEVDEDPRAPIRPTDIATNAEHVVPEDIDGGEDLGPFPELDTAALEFEALVEQAPLGSSLEIAATPDTSEPLSSVRTAASAPALPLASDADNLPAPETLGFPVVAVDALSIIPSPDVSDFEGGQALVNYSSTSPKATYVSSPRLTDVLPNAESTVNLPAQLRKYNDSLGLTQVRENNAALEQMAKTQELQLLTAKVVAGRPPILPTLRGGVEISDAPPPPPAPVLSIAELQALPPVVVQGLPSLTPILRDGRDVAELPDDPPIIDAPAEPEANSETEIQFTTIVSGLTVEQLQRIPPHVFTGRPENLPTLRGGKEILGGSGVIVQNPEGPELTDAQRLRPLSRPTSIEITALLASISKQAVPTAAAPLHRNADFEAKVKAMAAAIAEQARVTPTFNDAPREVNLPTSANVAQSATIKDGIHLGETSLIGVFGNPGNYSAIFRQRGGKYKTLKVGEKIDGWTIVAIDESSVRLQKGGKTKTLKLPAEG